MRLKLSKLHRVLGLVCGLVILIVFGTGAILCFDDEIRDFLDRDLHRQSERSLGPDELVKAFQPQLLKEERVSRLYLRVNKVVVRGPEGRRVLYFNPDDGRILGEGSQALRLVLGLHRRLLVGKFGRWITLTSTLGLLLLSLTGLKLWWPRNYKKLPAALRIKTTASRRRLFLDLHRVGGFYLLIPILIMLITGLNYSPLSSQLRAAVLALTQAGPIPSPQSSTSTEQALTLREALKKAQAVYPQAQLTMIEIPKEPSQGIKVRLRHPSQPGKFGRSSVILDAESGHVLRALNAMEIDFGQRLLHIWALPMHRGRAFGLPHQLLWLLACLGGMMLSLTGFWLWISKRKKKKPRDLPG